MEPQEETLCELEQRGYVVGSVPWYHLRFRCDLQWDSLAKVLHIPQLVADLPSWMILQPDPPGSVCVGVYVGALPYPRVGVHLWHCLGSR